VWLKQQEEEEEEAEKAAMRRAIETHLFFDRSSTPN
jgi:hypothetical protein